MHSRHCHILPAKKTQEDLNIKKELYDRPEEREEINPYVANDSRQRLLLVVGLQSEHQELRDQPDLPGY